MTSTLKEAAEKIHATRNNDGTYSYYDDATRETYTCTEAQMRQLGEYIERHGLGDGYSLWCGEVASF
jgi:cytosine/adenosine deaminase-related metal-dependent hydrolase